MIGTMAEPALEPTAPAPPPPPGPAAGSLVPLLQRLRRWPWRETLRTLGLRFRDERLGLTAGSLTFTTLIALVPLVVVVLALLSAFPAFARLELAVQQWLLQSLVPEAIARPVLQGLTRFAARAGGVGTAGLAVLALTALALLLTIDRTLNQIWRVRRPRPLGQRLLVYWGAITLAPLVLGLSLTASAQALSPRALGAVMPGAVGLLLDLLQVALLAVAAAALFHYVPNTPVRWRHAFAGGVFVALGIELAKQGLAAYVKAVPTYSVLYGAFATVPLLLLWVYLLWVVVLLGAMVAAYAPSLTLHQAPRLRGPGWRFELALELLRALAGARADGRHGLAPPELARTLRCDPLDLDPLLEHLAALDWVRRLDEGDAARLVLLCDPSGTPLAPLVQRLLLQPGPLATPLLARSGLGTVTLAQALAGRSPDLGAASS